MHMHSSVRKTYLVFFSLFYIFESTYLEHIYVVVQDTLPVTWPVFDRNSDQLAALIQLIAKTWARSLRHNVRQVLTQRLTVAGRETRHY